VVGKKVLKKNKIQLNFSNGNNLLTEKKEIKTGDSVLMEGNKIKDVLGFDKGVHIYLMGGRHISTIGKVEKVEGKKVFFSKGKDKFETLKKYAFVIGKKEPLISLKENGKDK
jgi:small subunit ribosomal protein S4e